MNMLNKFGEYEGIQMVGILMMHILSFSYFCCLIQLAAALCIYFISGTTELILYYAKTKEFELIIGGTVGDMHYLIRCKTYSFGYPYCSKVAVQHPICCWD
jgi:hypothetical protein